MGHLVQCEHQAEQVDQDPECVQDVMPVRTLAMIAMITVRGDTKNGHCYGGVSQKRDETIIFQDQHFVRFFLKSLLSKGTEIMSLLTIDNVREEYC